MRPIYISRFKHFPYILKPISLLVTVLILIALIATSYLPVGSTLIWITVCFALCSDFFLTAVLAFDMDEEIFPYRAITYNSMESAVSITSGILYFISMFLAIGGQSWSSGTWLTSIALLSLANFLIYLMNAVCYVRRWLAEHRLGEDDTLYNFPSYGAP